MLYLCFGASCILVQFHLQVVPFMHTAGSCLQPVWFCMFVSISDRIVCYRTRCSEAYVWFRLYAGTALSLFIFTSAVSAAPERISLLSGIRCCLAPGLIAPGLSIACILSVSHPRGPAHCFGARPPTTKLLPFLHRCGISYYFA